MAGDHLRRELPLGRAARAGLLRLCEAYGIPAWRATKPEEVAKVIAEARKAPGPALIDFHLDEAQNVYPMMLPGKGLSDMVEGAGE